MSMDNMDDSDSNDESPGKDDNKKPLLLDNEK